MVVEHLERLKVGTGPEDETAAAEGADEEEEETATLLQEGHMVRVVGGFICM